jgi:SAM-dependent methyltransferase
VTFSNGVTARARTGSRAGALRPPLKVRGPSCRLSDIWKAPLHDLPIRDEILYQYLPPSADMNVLEIGPGTGFTAFRLARQVRRLTLLDISSATIAELQRSLRGIPNLSFACADVCSSEFLRSCDGRFDAAFGLAVFEYVADPGACLRNLGAALRRGGHLLIQLPNYPPPRGPGITYIRTRAELDRLVDAAGFESWGVYELKLRPHAQFLFRVFHELPLQFYRRMRRRNHVERPQRFDDVWSFQNRRRLNTYRCLLHTAWMVLFVAMRLGGDCFECSCLGDEISSHNLLLLAKR